MKKNVTKQSKTNKKIYQYNCLVTLVASKIYRDYMDCIIFRPEPEGFFEKKMSEMGYSGDELMMFDTWRIFLYCLYKKFRVNHG